MVFLLFHFPYIFTMKNILIEIFPFQLHFFHFIKSLFSRQLFLQKSDKSDDKKG